MKRFHKAPVVAVLAFALVSGVARAEQQLGVEVYRGAQFLPSRSTYVKKATGVEASCYRTTDGVDPVTAFYARIPGFVRQESSVLRRGKVDVVIRPPMADPRTGAVGPYTVFCIMLSAG
jgi:hypothetical protein